MKEIVTRCKEVYNQMNIGELARNSRKNNQSLYAEVLEWLSDYYNEPKVILHGLAVYIIGQYAIGKFLQDELEQQ